MMVMTAAGRARCRRRLLHDDPSPGAVAVVDIHRRERDEALLTRLGDDDVADLSLDGAAPEGLLGKVDPDVADELGVDVLARAPVDGEGPEHAALRLAPVKAVQSVSQGVVGVSELLYLRVSHGNSPFLFAAMPHPLIGQVHDDCGRL